MCFELSLSVLNAFADRHTEGLKPGDSNFALGDVGQSLKISSASSSDPNGTVQTGSVVVAYVSSSMATWTCLVLLISVHLATNHAAVRSVSMRSLNRQRANIVLSNLLHDKRALTPEEVSFEERIFEWDGVLRWKGSAPIAKARIGVSLRCLLSSLAPAHDVTGAISDDNLVLQLLTRIYRLESFLLWYDARRKVAYIVLKEQASSRSQLKAWALALWVSHRLEDGHATGATVDKIIELLESSLIEICNQWDDCIEGMKAAGWDMENASLETMSARRIRLPAEGIQLKSSI